MLEFDEIDELLGLASGVDGNLRYEGTWLDNLRDGVGIALYPNGDKFEGDLSLVPNEITRDLLFSFDFALLCYSG